MEGFLVLSAGRWIVRRMQSEIERFVFVVHVFTAKLSHVAPMEEQEEYEGYSEWNTARGISFKGSRTQGAHVRYAHRYGDGEG